MNTADLVVTSEAAEGFYPTPKKVADMLVDDIDWAYIRTVLEPSAGKGDLIYAVGTSVFQRYGTRWGDVNHTVDVDCIEIDPHLRGVLQYEWGGQRMKDLRAQLPEHENWPSSKCPEIIEQMKPRKAVHFRVVHDDFLSFDSKKDYHLIIMNPPFSNGDAHLMKAIRLQERYGGRIRCILNAETLLNPFSKLRKALASKLEQYNADVSFLDGAFADGERKTDVRIAIIKIDIPAPHHESTIFDRLQKAAEVNADPDVDVRDLTVSDFMEQIVTRFNVEVDAGLELIREYEAMKPYILTSFDCDKYQTPSIRLAVGSDDNRLACRVDVNEYLKLVRSKYWAALFSNKEFIGKLTSNIQSKYHKMVQTMADYDFTLYNIQQLAQSMNAEMASGIQESIVSLFDRMTEKHSWYPECEKNVHYFNGWKTNQVHKINKKVILPVNGMFSCYSWERDKLNQSNAEHTIRDIEKVFDYLDGNMTAPVDLHSVIEAAVATGATRNMQCKYFSVTIYKKGTMHITFHSQELVDRFNIYCSRKKNWLPPNYGRATYSEMTAEEQAVVDSFHGDGVSGSGAESYAKVLERSHYFLSEPTREVQLLTSGA